MIGDTVIIDYGAGNVQSVKFALERLGVNAILTADKEKISCADKVIFPGVGEAKSAMDEIRKVGLESVIPSLKQDVLGICLGMQLMCTTSEERSTKCLGIFEETVKRFDIGEKIPHMGWNQVKMKESKLLQGIPEDVTFYFVHSYYVPLNPYSIGNTSYGIDFSSVMEKKNFFGCQFHPEKSSKFGSKILENFLKI